MFSIISVKGYKEQKDIIKTFNNRGGYRGHSYHGK